MSHNLPLKVPGISRYLVQRGIHGSRCFFADDDYLVYLDYLKEGMERYRCAIHAYALAAGEVRLLVSSEREDRISPMMRCVSGRYVEYVNYIYQRNGAFWERRLDSLVAQSARAVLGCYHGIESYPVRACLAASPADYRWSSYNHHAYGCEDAVIRDHVAYLGLGATESERQLAYRESFWQPLEDAAPAGISAPAHCSLAAGRNRRKDRIVPLAQRVRPGRTAPAMKTEYAIAA